MRIGEPDAQHADGARRAEQGDVERRGARQRAGAEPGGLAMLVNPAGDAELVGVELELAAGPRRQQAARPGHQDDDRGVEHLRHVPPGDLQQGVDAAGAGQLAAHGVERRRLLLAVMSRLGLRPRAHREAADDEPDDQHHGEGEQIADVADREREVRRDEEEVEGGDAQHGRQQRRAAAGSHGDHDDAEQIDHDQVRQLRDGGQRPGKAGGHRDHRGRARVGGPVGRQRAAT